MEMKVIKPVIANPWTELQIYSFLVGCQFRTVEIEHFLLMDEECLLCGNPCNSSRIRPHWLEMTWPKQGG